MSLSQVADFSTPHNSSDSFAAAIRVASAELQDLPINLATLARMDHFASQLPRILRDSTENLHDDRIICREAVVVAARNSLHNEIERVMAELDVVRQRTAQGDYPVDAVLLDEANCAALKARVSLNDQPFRTTMRHLDTARSILANLLVPGKLER